MKNRIKIVLTIVLAMAAALFALAACGEGPRTVNFYIDGEKTEVTAEADAALVPPKTEKEGYVFDGWYANADYTGEKQTPPATMPDENVDYYGRFLKQSTLTLTLPEGEKRYTVTEGTLLSEFLADKEPKEDGLIFGGWFLGDDPLSESAVMGKSDLALEGRFKVEYTLKLHRQNRAGAYSAETESETRTDWLGATIDPETLTFEHFSVDPEKPAESVVLQKGTVIELWLLRNTYHVYYIVNTPSGGVASGTMEPTEALYETVATVQDNAFRVEGYRFAGWMESAYGELSEMYEIGGKVELTDDIYLYAKWDKGYTDRFGGSDLIFLPTGEEDVVYLQRAGLEEKCGSYEQETRVFVFETGDGEELRGRLSRDGTFAYYGDENPGEYALIDAYITSPIEGKPWTLTLDEYDGAELAVSPTEKYTGVYTLDEESGDFLFIGDEGTPAEYTGFCFTTGTYGVENIPCFAIRGEEYGIYMMADRDGNVSAITSLDGYGIAILLTLSGTDVGTYRLAEDFASNGELIVQLLEQTDDGLAFGEEQIWKLLGEEMGGEKLFYIRDELFGSFDLKDGGSLEFNGYGEGVLAKGNKSYNGTYKKDGEVVIFSYNDGGFQTQLLLSVDYEEHTCDATAIGKEYGDYYLYNVKEKTVYTTLLHLDGLGGADWFAARTQHGSYEYDDATHIVTCTSNDGTWRFYLTEIEAKEGKYAVYVEENVLTDKNYDEFSYTGTFRNGEDTLELDGFRAFYKGDEYFYSIKSQRGFDGKYFVTLSADSAITLLITDADKTFLPVQYEVGTWQLYYFHEEGGRFTLLDEKNNYTYLQLNSDGTALITSEKSWGNEKWTVAEGTFAPKEGEVYEFIPGDNYPDFRSFTFKLSTTGNGTPIYLAYDERIAFTYHSEDGNETLVGDGYGNLTYSVGGNAVITARFSIDEGLYELDSKEKYEFKVLDEDEGIFKLAGSEARLYTLYDPSGEEQLRIVLDGDGHAELRRYDDDAERWGETFAGGTYAPSGRTGEWQFTSENESLYPSFKFIIPENAPYIAFMKYDPEADGRFDADNWAILSLDGYFGYYTGSSYTEANGRVHTGYYVKNGSVVIFEDDLTQNTYNLKLLKNNKFKRLGDEMGTYLGYDPLSGNIYSYPCLTLDGEGGATLELTSSLSTVIGTYAPYEDKTNEYVFTYREQGKEIKTRFRVLLSGNYALFLLHNDAVDGTFTAQGEGSLILDGYYGAIYTDAQGVRYEGNYYSYEYVPLSDEKVLLVTVIGVVEGGSASSEEDILVEKFLIDHKDGSLRMSDLAAGSYTRYSATMGLNQNLLLFLDGLGGAYVTVREASGEYVWQACSYELDLDTSEGSYTLDDVTQKFILVTMSDGYYSSIYCFIPFEEAIFGEFENEDGGRLVLDGYGNGTYYEPSEEGEPLVHEGVCYFYFSDYITDYTVVLIDESYHEYYFKIYRDAQGAPNGYKPAGSEVNDYYHCVVGSSGASVGEDEILTLDGVDKAELRRYRYDSANFQYVYEDTVLGTYRKKSETQDENGNTVITWTFIPNEQSGTGFDFQIRYIVQPFSYTQVPCFIKYDENYAGDYTCTTDEGELTLHLDGYEQATYTTANGTQYSGVYYRDGDNIYFTAYVEGSSNPRATFKVKLTDHTFTVDSDLAVKS